MTPYYQDEAVCIYHGDCREIGAAVIPADAVVLTDPPYGTGQKIAYDVYRDTMPEWLAVMQWLLALPHPMAFTMSHTRLFDLPKRPQWTGCWDKVFTGGITHVGANPMWEPICFYNLPRGDRGLPRWRDMFRCPPNGFPFNMDRERDGHPCQKPLDLYKQLIAVLPDDRPIVDPMMGSGTTLRAAKDVRRRAIGMDVSERYCAIAAERMRQSVIPLTTECA